MNNLDCECRNGDGASHQIYCDNCIPFIDKPRMSDALIFLLIKYSEELRDFDEIHGDRMARSMVDCIDFLLIEDDR